MSTTSSYEQTLFPEKARHYLLCLNDNCPRREHCLHWLVARYTPDNLRLLNVINPFRKDVVDGNCTDFRSDAKRRMARGMANFYDNIPELKAKAIRKSLIADYTKTKYFKMRNGTFPITPEDQSHIAAVCRANGWTEPLTFDSYYEEYDF